MRENGGKIQRDVRRDGAPNDDLRAVLDKLWGVRYTYMYIELRFASTRSLMPLGRPQRAEYVRRRRILGHFGSIYVPFAFRQGAGSFTSSGLFGVYGRVLPRAALGPVGPGPAEVRRSARAAPSLLDAGHVEADCIQLLRLVVAGVGLVHGTTTIIRSRVYSLGATF